MVGVVVGDEHAAQVHVVGGEDVDEFRRPVGRVDRDRVTGLAVADEVHEVHHLPGDLVVVREIATREQLAEVQTVLRRVTVHRPTP